MSTDWSEQDATEQAAAIERGELSAHDLVSAARERLEQLDPKLGILSVLSGGDEEAIERSLASEGPFRGVPFLMKDVGARQAGRPYYAGNRALRAADHRAAADTPLGARFRALGLVTLGNSRSPEFGLQSNTWPLVQGPTHNPWDPSRAAGGSSGGACAAVAAGLVAAAHASDGAGSIRIPAAWCGLIGLKPARDRIDWRHRGKSRPDVEFVVARSLRDTARFLDLLRPEACRRAATSPYLEALDRKSAPLRIAYWTEAPGGSAVHSDCVRAVEETVARLAEHGHRVERAAPPGFADYAERSLHGAVLGIHEYRDCLHELEDRIGRPVTADDVEPFLWDLAHLGPESVSADALAGSADWVRRWEERTLAWFASVDVLVTPTVCCPAPYLDDLDPRALEPLALLERMVPHMAFTEIWNATGQPAISLPLGTSHAAEPRGAARNEPRAEHRDEARAEALPIGVQLVAAPGREDWLLSLAAELLPTKTGLPHTPPIHA